jgi:hypothetical protein
MSRRQSAGVTFLGLALLCRAHAALAAGPAEVNAAIGRGIEFLKTQQQADGGWPGYGGEMYADGTSALAGLALSKSGLEGDDPAVAQALRYSREKADTCGQTYSAANLIMFLDSAGSEEDRGHIRRLAGALVKSQTETGTWSYFLPEHDGGGLAPLLGLIAAGGDNSNTQFAVLGLWVARRHEANVDAALERCGDAFRKGVRADGGRREGAGWGYTMNASPTFAMTCAGLIALATRHGTGATQRGQVGGAAPRRSESDGGKPSPATLTDDPQVKDALRFLARGMQQNAAQRGGYDLWSVERVGVIYGLKQIGDVDWYQWGADALLARQAEDGSFDGNYGPLVETSLALLFLSRANVAGDLTAIVAGDATLTAERGAEGLRRRVESAEGREAAEALVEEFADADAARRKAIIRELREAKGTVYSDALVRIISETSGALRDDARAALAARFGRLTPRSLAAKLKDAHPEVLAAAAQAALDKQCREVVGELIELVAHQDRPVRSAARLALSQITGEDFGPEDGATAVAQVAARNRWRKWREENP